MGCGLALVRSRAACCGTRVIRAWAGSKPSWMDSSGWTCLADYTSPLARYHRSESDERLVANSVSPPSVNTFERLPVGNCTSRDVWIFLGNYF